MKKRFLTMLAIVSFFAVGAFAQIQKGNAMVGGSAGFQNGDDATQVSLSPKVGYFVIDKLAIGASLDVEFAKAGDDKSTSFGLSPFARYYLTDGTPLKVFGEAGFGIARIKISGFDDTFKSNQIGLGIGASYFLNDNVAVDAIFGYNSFQLEDADRSNIFGLTIGVQAFFGGSSK
jgi:opacity protein-like surface antigen